MPYPLTYVLIPYTADRRERMREAVKAIEEHTDPTVTPYAIVVYENPYIGFPNAILDMVSGIDGYVFMCASDLIMGENWLRILWEKYDAVGRKGAVEPFNEMHKGRLCQHPLTHSDIVKKYFNRHYFHYFADNEMSERLMADGLYTYCPEAPMEHNHVLNGKAKMDEGYRVVLDKTRNEQDKRTYEDRRDRHWPE